MPPKINGERVRTTKYAPDGPFRVLERIRVLPLVAGLASNTPRLVVVGQWGGAGGAGCEDHYALVAFVRVRS